MKANAPLRIIFSYGEADVFANPRHPAGALVVLVALGRRGLAFGGEIHRAARDGNLAKLHALLKGNSDLVSSKDNHGYTPLHWAAFTGRKQVAEFLLADDAEVDAKANNGYTPLDLAAGAGHRDVAELLLASKAEVNAKDNKGVTPLDLAAAFDHKDVAELLLAVSANINARDNRGRTPLRLATLNHHKDVAELLRRHGGHT